MAHIHKINKIKKDISKLVLCSSLRPAPFINALLNSSLNFSLVDSHDLSHINLSLINPNFIAIPYVVFTYTDTLLFKVFSSQVDELLSQGVTVIILTKRPLSLRTVKLFKNPLAQQPLFLEV